MKKLKPLLYLAFPLMLLFISWGNAGHKVIVHIAESYLWPDTKDSIKYYLGNESLEDASVWADKILTDPEYKNTAPWHYVELPPGLKDGFPSTITEMIENKHRDNYYASIFSDIYHAIEYEQYVVKDKKSTKQQKAIALRFLINLIGDANEPMYICRAWDWNGNSLQPDIDNKYRKLQADREDSLLKTEGASYNNIALKIKTALSPRGGRLVVNEPSYWLIESYVSGQKLYNMVEKDSRNTTEYYKEETIASINESINQAGIRVADFLNNLFTPPYVPGTQIYTGGDTSNYKPIGKATKRWLEISIKNTAEFVGSDVSVTAKVYGIELADHSIELYLGAQYPDQRLTVVIYNTKYRHQAATTPLLDKTITVNGTIVMNNCRIEMVVDDAELTIKQ